MIYQGKSQSQLPQESLSATEIGLLTRRAEPALYCVNEFSLYPQVFIINQNQNYLRILARADAAAERISSAISSASSGSKSNGTSIPLASMNNLTIPSLVGPICKLASISTSELIPIIIYHIYLKCLFFLRYQEKVLNSSMIGLATPQRIS